MDCTRDAVGPVVAEGSQRQYLYLERSGFCVGSQIPWWNVDLETIRSGIVRFLPKCDMATHSMVKRRHFGAFCLALLYNFPALVYRSVESGALIAYSTKGPPVS